MKRSGEENGPVLRASGSSSEEDGDSTGRESEPATAASPPGVLSGKVVSGRGKRKGPRLKNRGSYSAPG